MIKDDLLILLEDGPHSTARLAEWVGHPTSRVDAALKGMLRDGLLKRVGPERRWALVGYQPPAYGCEGRRSKSEGASAKPPHVTATSPGSWWIGLSREAFAAGVKQRETARLGKKEHRQPQRWVR